MTSYGWGRRIRQIGLTAMVCLSSMAQAEELCVPFGMGHQVAGVLELPAQPTDTVALIMPGTHTMDRNGPAESFVVGEGVYTGMARLLREQGMAVARIDVPTESAAGRPVGCGVGQTVDHAVAIQREAYQAVAEYLRQQGHGHRFKRVLFVGHSQGGLVGAQILASHPSLADGFYMISMTLGTVADMARYQQRNIPMQTIRSLMDNGPDSCISNEQILAARALLEEVVRPIDRWLAPAGRWCKNSLNQLEASFGAQADRGAQLARDCNPSDRQDHVGEFGNTCQELQLFYSSASIGRLLQAYSGKIGIAYGKRDPLIALGDEGNAFRYFAAAAPNRWQVLLLDMGHNFGEHPYRGPAKEAALRSFANFVGAKR